MFILLLKVADDKSGAIVTVEPPVFVTPSLRPPLGLEGPIVNLGAVLAAGN